MEPVRHRPTSQPNVPANSRHPGPRAPLAVSYPAIWLATATLGRHRCPQKSLQTAPQPLVYPNSSPDHRAANSLTPFRCPHSVHPCPSVDSGLTSAVLTALSSLADDDRAEAEECTAYSHYSPPYDIPPSVAEELSKMKDWDLGASIADEIEKLGNLLDKGFLTQEEFDALKRKLLDM